MFCQISFSGFSGAGMNLKKRKKGQNDINSSVTREGKYLSPKRQSILRKQRRLLSMKDIAMDTQIGKD